MRLDRFLVFWRQSVEIVVGEVFVLVFQERHILGIVFECGHLFEIDAKIGFGHRLHHIIAVVVDFQGLDLSRLIDFRRIIDLVLIALDFRRDHWLFRRLVIRLVIRRRAPRPNPAGAHGFFGVEGGLALGADSRTTGQVVKLRPTTGANLFGAELWISQGGPFCSIGFLPDPKAHGAKGGGSLATSPRRCQNERPYSARKAETKPFRHRFLAFPARLGLMSALVTSHADPHGLTAKPASALNGVIKAPGDKSISHRALILGGIAKGITEIEGLLEGDDVLATGRAMQAMGAKVARLGPGRWRVEGAVRLNDAEVDCGNSGTGVRLLMGLAAGQGVKVRFDGDTSLRSRPMGRILRPLAEMGTKFDAEKLPLTVQGAPLHSISYRLPVASAQVKSAILLAGLGARGQTEVIEPEPTRDHTERMLRAFGVAVAVSDEADGRHIRLMGGQALSATEVKVPGDPSSAAFPIVAALVTPGSTIRIEGVLLNPLRTGLFQTLIEMGADLKIEAARSEGGEPVGDVVVRHSPLKGVVVPPDRAPSMIDEYPVLAVAAAFSTGETVMDGIGELRVKESDRIALTVAGLTACGVEAEDLAAGMVVRGTGLAPRGGAFVVTRGDHRIAMAHLVLGLGAKEPVTVDEPGMIATSFPGFTQLMGSLGAEISATDTVPETRS